MEKFGRSLVIVLAILGICMTVAWQTAAMAQAPEKKTAATKEIPQEELAASVPALSDLHTVIRPLWHDGYANKNYDLIKQLLPKADTLVAKLDAATLPGILKDKQEKWDAEKTNLNAALQGLHKAADANDQEGMLKQTEAFHMGFERLVRTIRPAVPELDAFHQELYKLYHYYMPAYDLAQIRSTAAAMKEKAGALKAAQLPKRLAEKQADYETAVKELETDVNQFNETVKNDSKEKIHAAGEKVHAAYQKLEKMFE